MDSVIPDPFNYEMKAPISRQPKQVAQEEGAIDAKTLANLDKMPKQALVDLVRRIGGARWAQVALMQPSEIAEAMRMRLAHIALTAEVKDAMTAIDRWLDRQEAKPMQRMEITLDMVESAIKTIEGSFRGVE